MPACCPPNSLGGATPLADSVPQGYMEKIEHDNASADNNNSYPHKPLPVYITGAPWMETKRVVLLCTDVYGIDAGHHKVVADRLASSLTKNTPTTVVIPDFFRGNPILKDYLTWLPAWIRYHCLTVPQAIFHCKFRVTDTALDADMINVLMPWLTEQTAATNNNNIKISCVGFCFGSWLAARASRLADLNLQCIVGIHPSFAIETIHGRTEVELARAIPQSMPVLLLPAQNDALKANVQNEAIQALAEARGVEETEVAIEFPTMVHGWVTRGDSSHPLVREEQARALQLTVDFIEKHHPAM